MKQRINLYRDELKPKKELLSLPMMLSLWGVALLIVVIWQALVQLQSADMQKQQQKLAHQVSQLNSQVAVATRQVRQRQPSTQLKQQRERLAADVEVKQLLQARLSDTAVLKRRSFSPLMRELAENHDRELWLQQITLRGGALELRGYAKRSEAVPRWVQKLQALSDDGRYRFASMSLARDEQERLTFTLTGH